MTVLSRTLLTAAVIGLVVDVAPSYAQRRSGGRVVAVARGGSRAFGSRVVVGGPIRVSGGYYRANPRVSWGFGIWTGYPYDDPYYYGYYDSYRPSYYSPYRYSYPYVYSYGYPAYRYPAYRYPAYRNRAYGYSNGYRSPRAYRRR